MFGRKNKGPCWDDYIFEDDDLSNRIPDERRIDKERWLSKDLETRLAFLAALENISDASAKVGSQFFAE